MPPLDTLAKHGNHADPDHDLGIGRRDMPQINVKRFTAMLRENGIASTRKKVNPDTLRRSQKGLNRAKVKDMASSGDPLGTIIVSRDDHILDGHHRWAAATERGQDIDALVVDLGIEELLALVERSDVAKATVIRFAPGLIPRLNITADIIKHLPGQHDQAQHGRRGSDGDTRAALTARAETLDAEGRGAAAAVYRLRLHTDGPGGVRAFTRRESDSASLPVRDGERQQVATKAVHDLTPDAKAILRAGGISTPVVHELDAENGGAEFFHAAISRSKEGNPYASSVFVYEPSEYRGMRLFVSDDGQSGIALKGDEIVSLFKTGTSGDREVSRPLLELGIQEGGRRGDCFDTVLPKIYAEHGLEVQHRVAWNDEYAPEGWDKRLYKKWNNGEPDVTFFRYNRDYTDEYRPGKGSLVDSYDDAVSLTQAAVLKHGQHDQSTHGNWAHGDGEYRMSHQPDLSGPSVNDLDKTYPGIYENPEWYASNEKADRESMAVINRVRGKPDAPVTIYRAVVPGVTQINPGDWVSLSRTYAIEHGMHATDPSQDMPVISMEVRARDVSEGSGNSINEWGYTPVDDVVKHGHHDQSTHGNWAHGLSTGAHSGAAKMGPASPVDAYGNKRTPMPGGFFEATEQETDDYYRADFLANVKPEIRDKIESDPRFDDYLRLWKSDRDNKVRILVGPNDCAVIVKGKINPIWDFSEDDLKAHLETVGTLQKISPAPGLQIMVDQKTFDRQGLPESVKGYVDTRDLDTMYLRPKTLSGDIDSASMMPVGDSKETRRRYVVTHEYGHVIDRRSDESSLADFNEVINSQSGLITGSSRYAREGAFGEGTGLASAKPTGREMFAEAWAGWVLSQGRQAEKQGMVKFFAEKYGWDAETASAPMAKAKRKGRIYVDSFGPEGGWVLDSLPGDSQETGRSESFPVVPTVVKFAPGLRPVLKHLKGQHDQQTHASSGSGFREVEAENNDQAWAAVLTDEAWMLGNRWQAAPERYNPFGTPGYGLKDGQTETRVVRQEGPPRVRDYQTSSSAGLSIMEAIEVDGSLTMAESGYGKPLLPVGAARPPKHVYRVMSEGEWQQAKQRGYIKSDERMNLSSDEGTVTSLLSTGAFYAPTDGSDYRVVRIKYADEDGWRTDPIDGYIKTDSRIPFDRVDMATTSISQASVTKHLKGQHDQKTHAGTGGGKTLTGAELQSACELWMQQSKFARASESRPDFGPSDSIPNEHADRLKGVVANRIAERLSDVSPQDLTDAAFPLIPGYESEGAESRRQAAIALSDDPEVRVWLTARGNIATIRADEIKSRAIAGYGVPPNSDLAAVAGSPEAEHLVRRAAVGRLVQQWAKTSNDQEALSLAIQDAAEAEFGIKSAAGWDKPDWLTRDVADLRSSQPVYRRFVRAQYDETQAMFKDMGVDSVTVQRGMGLPPDSAKRVFGIPVDRGEAHWTQSEVTMRPLSSWASNSAEAAAFGSRVQGDSIGVIIETTIPVSRVLSTPFTGNGCHREDELVLIGGPLTGSVRTIDAYRQDQQEEAG